MGSPQLFSLSPRMCFCECVWACTHTSFASVRCPEALFLLGLLGKMFGANQWWATGTCAKRPHRQRDPAVINLVPSTQRACRY